MLQVVNFLKGDGPHAHIMNLSTSRCEKEYAQESTLYLSYFKLFMLKNNTVYQQFHNIHFKDIFKILIIFEIKSSL